MKNDNEIKIRTSSGKGTPTTLRKNSVHLATIVLIVLSASVFTVLYAESDTSDAIKVDGFEYEIIDPVLKYVKVVGFDECYVPTALDIPSEVNIGDDTYTITAIGDEAFRDHSLLVSVTIPDSVTIIGAHAFARSGLTSVTIPDSVTGIGEYAFADIEDLAAVVLSSASDLEDIGAHAFEGTAITTMFIPDSVTSIGDRAFMYTYGLETVIFSDTSDLESIGAGAFIDSGLTFISIPDSVTSIGEGAFAGAYYLSTVVFSGTSNLESIGDSAFVASGLISIDIPDSVTHIGYEAFAYAGNLAAVTLSDAGNLESIGGYAFAYTGLISIDIPDSVTSIGGYAFAHSDLISIIVPQHTSLADSTFDSCQDLVDVTVSGTGPTANDGILTLVGYEWKLYQGGSEIDHLTIDSPYGADLSGVSILDGKKLIITSRAEVTGADFYDSAGVPIGTDDEYGRLFVGTYDGEWHEYGGTSYSVTLELDGPAEVDYSDVFYATYRASYGDGTVRISVPENMWLDITTMDGASAYPYKWTIDGSGYYVPNISINAVLHDEDITVYLITGYNEITLENVSIGTVGYGYTIADDHISGGIGTFDVPKGVNVAFTVTGAKENRAVFTPTIGPSVEIPISGGSFGYTPATDGTITFIGPYITVYTVTASSDTHSDITPSGSVAVSSGGSVTFRFSAAPGYAVSDVTVDGLSRSDLVTAGSYTFSNIDRGHTISVASSPITATITISASVSGGEGHIEYRIGSSGYTRLGGSVTLPQGSDVYVRAVPSGGYRFVKWTGTVTGTDAELHIGSRDASVTADLKQNESPVDNTMVIIAITVAAVLVIAAVADVAYVRFFRHKG